MKIAIHHSPGSFSDIWVKYCQDNSIDFKFVDCYQYDIVKQLSDCDGLMWHWDQNCYKAAIFARELTMSLEKQGIKVFPDSNTSWHHDDKLGQKYLFEAINAPLVETYVFYTKQDALKWSESTNYPKVFKLRGGAGSVNVSLAHSKKEAQRLIRKAFRHGFSHINRVSRLKDRLWVLRRDRNQKALRGLISGIARLVIPTEVERFSTNHKGYIYFQDFIPQNEFDTRLVVVEDRCYGVIRYCRKGDFRASGSGIKSYEPELFDKEAIKIAFRVAKKLKLQSAAFDFIQHNGEFKIIELSYCFVSTQFPGYWNEDLEWVNVEDSPQEYMVKKFISSIV